MRKGLIGLLCVAVLSFAVGAAGTLDVYFINVGHGDAILVKYGTTEWLIDTGYENQWPDISACEDFFPVPVDPPIEYFVLSHDDQDHYSALDKVLCSCGIERVFSSPDPDSIETLQDEIQEASQTHSTSARPDRIEELSSDLPVTLLGFELEWMVLYPTTEEAMDTSTKDNDKSLVLLLTFGNVSFLFTGDIERRAELLLALTPPLDGTLILKAAHHGSDSSTSLEFLEWADPELAIVSCDDDDMHATTIGNLGQHGVPFLTTHANGTICVSTDGISVWVETNLIQEPNVNCLDD